MKRTLIQCGWLVTLDDAIGDFHGAELLFTGDRIEAVGKRLNATADEVIDARPKVKTYVLGERRVHVLVDGALVNIAGLDGNPIEIMDLSFSVQALSAHLLASGAVPPGLNRFPDELGTYAEIVILRVRPAVGALPRVSANLRPGWPFPGEHRLDPPR